jgi:hypothetical protein
LTIFRCYAGSAMKRNKILIKIVFTFIILVVTMGCHMDTAKSEEITIEGIFCKDTGHPFPGPAIMGQGGYYRLRGENAQKIYTLRDKTKIRVSGRLYTSKRTIPEAGTFREITEKIIEVKSFEVIK